MPIRATFDDQGRIEIPRFATTPRGIFDVHNPADWKAEEVRHHLDMVAGDMVVFAIENDMDKDSDWEEFQTMAHRWAEYRELLFRITGEAPQ